MDGHAPPLSAFHGLPDRHIGVIQAIGLRSDGRTRNIAIASHPQAAGRLRFLLWLTGRPALPASAREWSPTCLITRNNLTLRVRPLRSAATANPRVTFGAQCNPLPGCIQLRLRWGGKGLGTILLILLVT